MSLSRSSNSLRASLRLLKTPKTNITTSSRILALRPLSTTSPLYKKRKVAVPDASRSPSSKRNPQSIRDPDSESAPSKATSPADPEAPDPLDFTPLLDALAPIDVKFKAQLQTLLHGGRFNPDVLGNLQVAVKEDGEDAATPTSASASKSKGGKDGKKHDKEDATAAAASASTNYPLRELAQIVPRGRTHISLLLNSQSYTKPILSAIQSSPDFNQQPQKSDDNPLELIIRVEMERKEDSVKRVKEVGQQWREKVRQARGKHEKVMKEWKKKGVVLPDDLRRGEKELQKLQDGKMKEIEGEEAKAIKQLQR